eukprot:1151450-Pelagomonas_calceolata.AAC.8
MLVFCPPHQETFRLHSCMLHGFREQNSLQLTAADRDHFLARPRGRGACKQAVGSCTLALCSDEGARCMQAAADRSHATGQGACRAGRLHGWT